MTHNFLTRPTFSHPDMARCFDDASLTRAMLDVEAALARVQDEIDVIPKDAAMAIAESAARLEIETDRLVQGVARAGVPVPALVAALQEAVGPPHDDWVYWGATSQDIVDTAMSLVQAKTLGRLQCGLAALIDQLQEASSVSETTLMVGRTRGQLATPITFGLRAAQWAQPLIALEAELPDLRRRVLKVQFGGAAGSRSVVAPLGFAIAMRLAEKLGLATAMP